jgi:hypothetical protein
MEQHTVTTIQIKVVNGTILAQDNDFGSEYDLFYWANFVPHFVAGEFLIIGECGFDKECEKSNFSFQYEEESDTVTITDYRTAICNPEEFARYKLHIKFKKPRTDETIEETIAIPWIRFPRTKDGVSIPQLIERIFGRIPKVMMFL